MVLHRGKDVVNSPVASLIGHFGDDSCVGFVNVASRL